MVAIREFRITMPVSLDEYHIGHLYAIAEASKSETGGGEGVEVLKNEPTDKGQFTHKIYHLSSRVPAFIRAILPSGALEVHEEAWNDYPYCKTVMSNPYMKDKFQMVVETIHVANDRGKLQNALKLPAETLKKREVVQIDIAYDKIDSKDYKKEEDPVLFRSDKTGRGLLQENWNETVEPVMTCYKLVTIEFKWFGLQTAVESFVCKTLRNLFTKINRQLFCYIDKWFGLTIDDIRKIEEQTKKDLEEKFKQPSQNILAASDQEEPKQ